MSKDTANGPTETVSKVKKRKVSFAHAKAILDVHERKKVGHYCDYKSIAARYQISANGLRHVYCKFLKGEVDLGVIEDFTPERIIDKRAQHAKTLELVTRHMDLVLIHYEGAIFSGEDQIEQTGKKGYKKKKAREKIHERHELCFLSKELMKLMHMRKVAEDGYASFLEDRNPPEKTITPKEGHPASIDVQTHVITANDEQRAIEALSKDDPPPAAE